MTPLRAKYVRDMAVRGLALRTQQADTSFVADLARPYHRSPDRLPYEQVVDWIHHLIRDRHLGLGPWVASVLGPRTGRLHGIVIGGALGADGRSWRAPQQRKFLFPVRALAALFRGKFLHGLKALLEADDPLRLPDARLQSPAARARWFSGLYAQRWVVYAKRPFGGPEQVLSYLAQFTHRVALSNRRLVDVDRAAQTVTFTYRDYRDASKVKRCTLSAREFIRRFAWHILPLGMVRIRHYGLLANHRRKRDIAQARAILERRGRRRRARPGPPPPPPPRLRCPGCGHAGLRWIGYLDAQGRTHLQVRVPMLDSS